MSRKIEIMGLTKAEAARTIRDFADALEHGRSFGEGASEADLSDFRKVKIGLKRDMGTLTLKIGVKEEKPDVPENFSTGDGRKAPLRYKDLKKRMKHTFKVIFAHAADNAVPPEEVVESFLQDSDRMITFPGKGDPHYAEYAAACTRLAAAAREKDIESFREAAMELNRIKTACHDRFK